MLETQTIYDLDIKQKFDCTGGDSYAQEFTYDFKVIKKPWVKNSNLSSHISQFFLASRKPSIGGQGKVPQNMVWKYVCISQSVQSLSCVQLFVTPWTADARLPSLSPTPRVCSNSYLSSQWSHPSISSSVTAFSSYLQSFPASGSFPMSQFFTSGSRSSGASASASVLLENMWDWFPLGLTGWISLLSKELSGVFSCTTVQKHQFFSAQLSLWFNFHVHTWLLEKS